MRTGTDQREARAELVARLRGRRGEIEAALLARIQSISEPGGVTDPEYVEGLRSSMVSSLEYGLAAIERGEDGAPPLPGILLIQARLAARYGVSLDTVLRRYFAGFTLLGDFMIEESGDVTHLSTASLKRLLRVQGTLFDRLIAAVSEEYAREAAIRPRSTQQRLAERIERLLEGQPIDTSDIAYDFGACHIGLLAAGAGAEEAIRELAATFDRRLLLAPRGEATVWAWLGGQREADRERLEHFLEESWPPKIFLALGEPARGVGGWRLTHQQASAALSIAMRSQQAFTRYADVALLASMLQDDLLLASLRKLYLTPLEAERGGGETLCKTLRTYFASGRNITSAAASLGVSRQAVAKRLGIAEKKLSRPLSSCGLELEAALRLEALNSR